MARTSRKTTAATPTARQQSQPEEGPKFKTAVVVVHGMGEQRPLETLREFVETVYQRDPTVASMPPGDTGLLNISVVPDDVTGSAELRRITTHIDGPQKRTDFFEFYWADIMDGTPLEMVTGWIRALLLRSPFRLPRLLKVKIAWAILLLLAALIVLAGAIAAYPGLGDAVAGWRPMQQIGSLLAFCRPGIAGTLIALSGLALAWRVVRAKAQLHQVSIGLPLALLLAGSVLWLIPSAIAGSIQFWAGAITAGMAYGMHALVAPFAGDVVRYVRATPSTVERRRLVRERGVALLEALHQKRLNGPPLERFLDAPADNMPMYDRIVIVGHSLGTIIGYDIMQLFWDKYGPSHHRDWDPAGEGVQDALNACDAYVKAHWANPADPFDGEGFAQAQAALYAALNRQDPKAWRISDFITLGSPLAHAEFLLVDSADAVEKAAEERRFATAPPHPDPFGKGSMLFSRSGMLFIDGDRSKPEPLYPHFAAQFAAVKWTNVFDESPNPLLGDLISGSLARDFGPGIEEHPVSITRPGRWGVLKRVFTHTQYWTWHHSYAPSPENAELGSDMQLPEARRRQLLWHKVPKHITALRIALRLGT